ncbi:MAG: hypothetical protein KGK01_04030 [Bradyrhizobium sp.]|uniref:hypothetical protein n=1 Tax=Bradyrhizobium sp. TaxID=376 RepID=UPI001C2A3B8A|nr:hypothetical protein [Bradyrhizobium sp.]MBU6463873.1 hypothetical protein [Pseudomonadota bacterium]MDE2065881.1 hypothetical protein [Bradyrhizobium sp.]MDE2241629.1 hypothetical protein [Bradyrhizobium sp.]MDE2468989.1 hypothetical protein [Bradyrhizobium sp.]
MGIATGLCFSDAQKIHASRQTAAMLTYAHGRAEILAEILAKTIEFHWSRPEFGFISLKRWLGTILMNGC